MWGVLGILAAIYGAVIVPFIFCVWLYNKYSNHPYYFWRD